MFAVDFLKEVTKCVVATTEALEKVNIAPANVQIDQMLEKEIGLKIEGKNVIIVGGGDTGNDCCGTSIRLGAASVTQIEMMPCPPVERAESNPWPQWPKVLKTDYGAEESIAVFGHDPRVYETTIKEIYSENGKVTGVKTVEVEFQIIDGKRQLVERKGTEKDLKADLVLIAAGFTGCEEYTAQAFETEISPRGTIVSNGKASPSSETGYSTSVEKVFTAGDMHRGQSLVVWAITEGRECAKEIDDFLMK